MFKAYGRRLSVVRLGWLGWFLSGCFVFMGLILGAGLVDPNFIWKVFGVVMAATCFGIAYVLWRGANVVLYERGTLVGSPLGPRWIPWDEVQDVSLQQDRNLWAMRGHVPVIQLKSGRSVKLGLFFVLDGATSEGDLAQRVTLALRAHLSPKSDISDARAPGLHH
jgi:hypothetical protein